MKHAIQAILAFLLVSVAHADTPVFSDPNFEWIVSDAQLIKLRPWRPWQSSPPVSLKDIIKIAEKVVKEDTNESDWILNSCELRIAPGQFPPPRTGFDKWIYQLVWQKEVVEADNDLAYVILLHDGTPIPKSIRSRNRANDNEVQNGANKDQRASRDVVKDDRAKLIDPKAGRAFGADLGWTEQEFASRFEKLRLTRKEKVGPYAVTYTDPTSVTFCFDKEGLLFRVYSWDPAAITNEGLKMHDPEEKLVELYGKSYRTYAHANGSATIHEYLFDDRHLLTFAVAAKKVENIAIELWKGR